MQIDVLYQDARLVVVNKPSGLLVHRGWGRDRQTLVSLLREQLGLARVHAVHRLDRGTSGVMVVALDPDAARHMGGAFSARQVFKRYLALTRGEAPERGDIDHPIPAKEGGERVASRTVFRRLAIAQSEPRHTSLVAARPLTGRLHQIRRHLKHINHPLIGDARHGKGSLNRAFHAYGLTRLALHAEALGFWHPDGAWCVFQAPLPPSLTEAFLAMGLMSEAWSLPCPSLEEASKEGFV